MRIPQALSTPVLLSLDNAANAGLPACASCSAITPAVTATPSTTAAPGQPVVVDARGSFANACPSGALQFRFWYDANGSNAIEETYDVLLRAWTDNPIYIDAPAARTPSSSLRYGVQVRCSADHSCGNPAAFTTVTVTCPSTGTLPPIPPFAGAITFANKSTIVWTTSQPYEAIRGDLGALRATGGSFAGTVKACLADAPGGTSVVDAAVPASGSAHYYLTRSGAGACNQPATWSTNHATEVAGRDDEIGADPTSCP